MAIATGLCAPWIDAEDASSCGEAAGLDDVQVGQVAMFASEVLYVMSNRQWPGVCPRTVRPAPIGRNWRFVCVPAERAWWAAQYGGSNSWSPWLPNDIAYIETSWPFRYRDTLRLPGPVSSITHVLTDNVVMPVGNYILDGRNTIRRLDGKYWPIDQDLTRAATTAAPAPSTDDPAPAPAWEIKYEWGATPPTSGVIACTSFFCEIALAFAGDSSCALPWAGAVATVARQGVTVNYSALHDQFVNGYVGLADVDLWLNMARGGPWRPRKPRVARADARRRAGRTTWS